MATTAPIGFDTARLRDRVRETYDHVARDPRGEFHFHRGAAFAAERLGYDADELAALPAASTDAFAGVGNPIAVGPIHAGETVLDHACGAGMDLLLAARRVGPRGRAIGVDMTPGMRARARQGAREAGLEGRVSILDGLYEELPVADAGVDVVISNGVVNLAPDKGRVLREIARVLRPGGRLHLADVIVARELTLPVRSNAELWAACVGGALTEAELHALARDAGLVGCRTVAWFDCFAGTSAAEKVSKDLRVRGMSFVAAKP
ncbi:MAG: methyltransferase domain-containing protein [Sandaracinaceae bacterium]|nr:methyltransferase domain-containing protein [Sandaracinaceae bacterium]